MSTITARPHTLYALVDSAETHWDAVAAYLDVDIANQREAQHRYRAANLERVRRLTRESVRRCRARKKNAARG